VFGKQFLGTLDHLGMLFAQVRPKHRQQSEDDDHTVQLGVGHQFDGARIRTIAGIGDVEAQTRQVLENIKAAMEAAGGTLDDVCRVDVYIRNMEHFDAIHKVRREYFKPPLPASTMVEVTKMVSPEYLIEISAIGVIAGA